MIKYIALVLALMISLISYLFYKKKDNQYDHIINKAADRHQIPFSIIKAVIGPCQRAKKSRVCHFVILYMRFYLTCSDYLNGFFLD